jgi:hypothetical protein
MKQILLQITLGLIFIVAIILFATNVKASEEPFKEVVLSGNNTVSNNVSISYLDTIMSVGLDKMGIEGITVVISDLSDAAKDQFNGELKAHVRFFNGVYYLFIDKLGRHESMRVIAHEIIHINQYNTGKLYYDQNGQLFWDGELFDLNNIEYEIRPWERDAYSDEGKLYSEMYRTLVSE